MLGELRTHGRPVSAQSIGRFQPFMGTTVSLHGGPIQCLALIIFASSPAVIP